MKHQPIRYWAKTAVIAGLGIAIFSGAMVVSAQQGKKAQQGHKKGEPSLGYTDTPYLPDGKWRVHDIARPHPPKVTPGKVLGQPPSDAVILFDGKDLSKWMELGRVGKDKGKIMEPRWKVKDGYMEVTPNSGMLFTKEKFGDCQLHVEWYEPADLKGASQLRGNSGVMLMSRYEIQVLESWDNNTYADGQAGAIYGQYPPLVNPTRKPGEWNTYDIVFQAPHFEGDKVVQPAYETIFFNGVLVHNHTALVGAVAHRRVGKYAPHAPEEPLMLQSHGPGDPVRFRNIWIRRLKGYDQQ